MSAVTRARRASLLSCTIHRPLSSHRDLAERATGLLDRFGLQALARDRATEIAYGDQRRLEVALSLAGRPRVLLLDEPMAGLSAEERGAMRTLLGELDEGMAVLLIEHDMDVAFSFARTVTVLHQGRVLTGGSRDEVSASDLVQQIYLGTHTRPGTVTHHERELS